MFGAGRGTPGDLQAWTSDVTLVQGARRGVDVARTTRRQYDRSFVLLRSANNPSGLIYKTPTLCTFEKLKKILNLKNYMKINV